MTIIDCPSTPDVIGYFAALRVDVPDRCGDVSIRCPEREHEDRHASASLNTETGAWYCHACGQGGGPFAAATALGYDKRDAAELCKRHGLWRGDDDDEPARVASSRTRPPERRRDPDPLPTEDELRAWQERLLASDGALERLRALRGWTRTSVEHFDLGFDGERIVFPVRDCARRLLTVERYKPGQRGPGERKMLAPAGRPRELFPAPESVEGEEVLLVEGAPDVPAAREIGMPAVSIPGVGFAGVVEKWALRLAGRRVVVCFDCDREGRRAAERVAPALAEHAAEVRVVDLDPGRDDGYDLTDLLLEARAAANDDGPRQARVLLERLAADARPLAVQTNVAAPGATVPPPLEELAPGTTGGGVAGLRRLDVARMVREHPPEVEWLVEGPDLLVLDSLRSLWGGEENESAAAAAVLDPIRRLFHRHSAGGLLLHHTPKAAGAYRGSSAIGASVDLGFRLSRAAEDTDRNRRYIETWKCRPAAEPPKRWLRLAVEMGMVLVNAADPFEQDEREREAPAQDEVRPRVVAELRDQSRPLKEIAAAVGKGPKDGTVRRVLLKLAERGEAEQTPDGWRRCHGATVPTPLGAVAPGTAIRAEVGQELMAEEQAEVDRLLAKFPEAA